VKELLREGGECEYIWSFPSGVNWVKVVTNDQSWSNDVVYWKEKLGERVNT
jgi:hypothetical protein